MKRFIPVLLLLAGCHADIKAINQRHASRQPPSGHPDYQITVVATKGPGYELIRIYNYETKKFHLVFKHLAYSSESMVKLEEWSKP